MKYSAILFLFIFILFECQSKKKSPMTTEQKKSNRTEDLGDSIATIAQIELLKNVQKAMKEGGPTNAIQYCNIHASDILENLAKKYNCQIKRISLKNRNPNHYPVDPQDLEVLQKFEKISIEEQHAFTINDGDKNYYYKPIYTAMPACLKCHGKPDTDIDRPTQKILAKLYPKDRATGYALNDFRGAWKIIFSSQ